MDIRDVLTELGVPFAEADASPYVTAGWVGIVCPMPGCGQGGKHGRGINLRTLRTTCWKCGTARLGDVLSAASGRPLREVLALLPRLAEDTTPGPTRPRGRYKPPDGVGPLLPAHKRYLSARGFDPDEIAALWGVGGLGPLCALQWRLFLPVTMNGVPVSWTTRAIGTQALLRYRAADPADEDVPIHNTLYGWDMVRHAVVVVEGPADAWAVGPGAVATFGLGVTPVQTALLSAIPTRVILFDSDPAAQRRAAQLASDLEVFPGSTYVARTSGKDPAESPKEEILEIRRRFLA